MKPPIVQNFRPRIREEIERNLRSTSEIEAQRERQAREEHNKRTRFLAVMGGMVLIAAGTIYHMSKEPALNYGTPDQATSIKQAESDENIGKFKAAAEIYRNLAETAAMDKNGALIMGKPDDAEKSGIDHDYFLRKQQEDEKK